MTRARRPAGGDTGAALIMALALTTFLGLVMGALLSYGSASVRSVVHQPPVDCYSLPS